MRAVQDKAGFQLDPGTAPIQELQPIFEATHNNKTKPYVDAVIEDLMLNIEEECTIPQFKDKIKFVFPEHYFQALKLLSRTMSGWMCFELSQV